jgi:hypothetical protein
MKAHKRRDHSFHFGVSHSGVWRRQTSQPQSESSGFQGLGGGTVQQASGNTGRIALLANAQF